MELQNINLLDALPRTTQNVLNSNLIGKILGISTALLVIIYVVGIIDYKFKQLKLTTLQQTSQSLLKQITNTNQAIDSLKTRTLPEISPGTELQTLGFSPYLNDLAQSMPEGVWLEQIDFSQPEDSIQLQGITTSIGLIPVFFNALNNSNYLANKKFSTMVLQKIQNSNETKFIIGNVHQQAEVKKAETSNKNESTNTKT